MSADQNQDISIINAEEILRLVTMDDAIDAMESAFASFSDGSSQVPQRYVSEFGDLNLFLKPAYSKKLGRIAVKIISQKLKNFIPGSPTIQGTVLLMDLISGAILSMMDGAYITALRTGAASGIATKLLAKEDAESVAIFGCGVQGKTQLEAVCAVRTIKKAILFDLNAEAANSLKEEMEEKEKIDILVADSLDELKHADIICTATTAEKPLFSLKDISKGTHINAVGSYKPTMQEIDPAIIKSGSLYVDSVESVLKESGDLIKPINDHLFSDSIIRGEIGELVNNKVPGRQHFDEITIFKSVGLGVQDLFMANQVYEKFLSR